MKRICVQECLDRTWAINQQIKRASCTQITCLSRSCVTDSQFPLNRMSLSDSAAARLAESHDTIVQQSVRFTKWLNSNWFTELNSGQGYEIQDIASGGLSDGVGLLYYFEKQGRTGGPFHKNPKNRFQKLENCQAVLDWLGQEYITVVGIRACDLVDCNVVATLGLVWTIILRYPPHWPEESGKSAKRELMDWVVLFGIDVTNFTGFWTAPEPWEKLISLMLIAPVPTLPTISFAVTACHLLKKKWDAGSMVQASPIPANLSSLRVDRCIRAADSYFEIPQILDAIDVVNQPDELSNMTYLAYFREWFQTGRKEAPIWEKVTSTANAISNMFLFSQSTMIPRDCMTAILWIFLELVTLDPLFM